MPGTVLRYRVAWIMQRHMLHLPFPWFFNISFPLYVLYHTIISHIVYMHTNRKWLWFHFRSIIAIFIIRCCVYYNVLSRFCNSLYFKISHHFYINAFAWRDYPLTLKALWKIKCNLITTFTSTGMNSHTIPYIVEANSSRVFTHWGQDQMAAVLKTTCSNVFSRMKMFEVRLKFY